MSRGAFLVLAVVASAAALTAQMIDRTVAIVDDEAITESEVVLQLRLEALTNAVEVFDAPAERERALDRLIDQRLIAQDIRLTGLPPISPEDLADLRAQLYEQVFGELSFETALERYGVSEAQALAFFARQVEFSRYVDFRFRTGQTVSDEELRQASRSNGDAPPPLASPQLRDEILNARVERLLEQHIRQLRVDHRVVRLQRIDRSAVAPSGGTP